MFLSFKGDIIWTCSVGPVSLREISFVFYVHTLVCALMMQKLCTEGMRNTKLGNHLKKIYSWLFIEYKLLVNLITLQFIACLFQII